MILFLHPHIKDLFWTHLKRLIHRYQEWRGEFFTRVPAPPPEEQQVPDGEQASSRSAGEERHEGDAGHGRKRRLLVLHPALLQTALHWRQRESSWAWFIGQGTSQLMFLYHATELNSCLWWRLRIQVLLLRSSSPTSAFQLTGSSPWHRRV